MPILRHSFTGLLADARSGNFDGAPGDYIIEIGGTFSGGTVDIEYTVDGGTTWTNVGVAALVGATSAVAATAISIGWPISVKINGGDGSTDVDVHIAAIGH